jgi:hypothetical protein
VIEFLAKTFVALRVDPRATVIVTFILVGAIVWLIEPLVRGRGDHE